MVLSIYIKTFCHGFNEVAVAYLGGKGYLLSRDWELWLCIYGTFILSSWGVIKNSTAPKQGSNIDTCTTLCGELIDKNWDEEVEMITLVFTVVLGQSSGSKG